MVTFVLSDFTAISEIADGMTLLGGNIIAGSIFIEAQQTKVDVKP